jgi:uncharacterized protein
LAALKVTIRRQELTWRDTIILMSTTRQYRGSDVPMRVIRRYAHEIAAMFHPEKIILFGSHAYGTPHDDSDVDLLVVMSARNELDQAAKIRLAITPPFPVDLLVRKPSELKWRLEEGESFSTEVIGKGKVLYEAVNAGMGSKSEGRPSPSPERRRRSKANS